VLLQQKSKHVVYSKFNLKFFITFFFNFHVRCNNHGAETSSTCFEKGFSFCYLYQGLKLLEYSSNFAEQCTRGCHDNCLGGIPNQRTSNISGTFRRIPANAWLGQERLHSIIYWKTLITENDWWKSIMWVILKFKDWICVMPHSHSTWKM